VDLVKFQVALLAAHPPDNVEARMRQSFNCALGSREIIADI
jgi:hypothetical protein